MVRILLLNFSFVGHVHYQGWFPSRQKVSFFQTKCKKYSASKRNVFFCLFKNLRNIITVSSLCLNIIINNCSQVIYNKYFSAPGTPRPEVVDLSSLNQPQPHRNHGSSLTVLTRTSKSLLFRDLSTHNICIFLYPEG